MLGIIEYVLKKYNLKCDLNTILTEWSRPHRGYHSISHLDDLINLILLDKEKYNELEFDILILSAIFHDIVYIPFSKENEEISVDFFKNCFPSNYNHNLLKVIDIIMATKTHQSQDYLCQIFNQYDMDIVTRDYEQLLEWEKGIQHEYMSSMEYKEPYKKGRIEFLESLLKHYPSNRDNLTKLIDYVKEF
jgi:pantetheine-phosphate adenylyltransferase